MYIVIITSILWLIYFCLSQHSKTIVALNRLIIFPIYAVLTVMRFVNKSPNLMIMFTIFFALTVLIALFHFIFILRYELSANRKALRMISKNKKNIFIKDLYTLGKIFVVMQLIFERKIHSLLRDDNWIMREL